MKTQHVRREIPLTEAELDAHIEAVNDAADPFVPLVNCSKCGLPIEEEAVIDGAWLPPQWMHPWCDEECFG